MSVIKVRDYFNGNTVASLSYLRDRNDGSPRSFKREIKDITPKKTFGDEVEFIDLLRKSLDATHRLEVRNRDVIEFLDPSTRKAIGTPFEVFLKDQERNYANDNFASIALLTSEAYKSRDDARSDYFDFKL